MYIEPWHADIFEFLDLKKNTGSEEHRARDLFYALWICDLFMERVKENGTWSLLCPNECKGLYEVHGKEFEELYLKYEQDRSKVRRVIKAQDLWIKIIHSQIETGTPYMLYKDACNAKSNQQNLGTIKSSNLCAEICEYTDKEEIAVCNLASICLPKFVKRVDERIDDVFEFDHDLLYIIVKHAVYNLNKIIDKNFYPLPEARRSNMRHRPVGLGVQGLADVFAIMRLPFACESAKILNREISETMYFAALVASHELALQDGAYETFNGSPLSVGLFQFDLWDGQTQLNGRWDWEQLRRMIVRDGVRNSLLIALMPTASTAQIMGNNDAFEPFTSNLYTRRVLSGEFIIVNKYLLNDLMELGLWNDEMKEMLMQYNGSVQNLNIPDELKEIYKTVWEVSMKDVIDMAADRGRFVDQSQSMNLFLESPQIDRVSKMHMYAWSKGLKTGMYYLRTKSAMNAVKVTLTPQKEKYKKEDCGNECLICSA
jgi:ribonucleoside-diphosphate reductase alpha chain